MTDDRHTAITELIEQHAGMVYGLGRRFCGNDADAEDLVQNVFLQAYRGWDGFEGRSSPTTWLYTIAARTCQRMHRRRSGEPAHVASLDVALPFEEPRIAALPSSLDTPDAQRMQVEARERLEAAIAALPEPFRVPILLKEIVGFSVAETAAILGLEEGTVRSRLHRARLRLRDAVDGALPRQPEDAPPPAYDRQTCLDLLNAKQAALDHDAPFDSAIICARCQSVFASLDLAHDLCRQLAADELPADVRERLTAMLQGAAPDPA